MKRYSAKVPLTCWAFNTLCITVLILFKPWSIPQDGNNNLDFVLSGFIQDVIQSSAPIGDFTLDPLYAPSLARIYSAARPLILGFFGIDGVQSRHFGSNPQSTFPLRLDSWQFRTKQPNRSCCGFKDKTRASSWTRPSAGGRNPTTEHVRTLTVVW
jgi:hypothetical protein